MSQKRLDESLPNVGGCCRFARGQSDGFIDADANAVAFRLTEFKPREFSIKQDR
ncbi:hypothetical protein N185_03540 [Sinorhizobium sp. GW3]|nr:hypothetical protein N185_03540 [Sinorhizobium sp. GW3]